MGEQTRSASRREVLLFSVECFFAMEEPVSESRSWADIVQSEVRERRHRVEVNGEPRRRDKSVLIDLQAARYGAISSNDVVEYFDGQGISESEIMCLQGTPERNVIATFSTAYPVDQLLDIVTPMINEYPVIFRRPDSRKTYVKVMYLPYEVSNDMLKVNLEDFGHISQIRQDRLFSHTNILNGIRTVTMTLQQEIPSYINVDGYRIKVYYRGQKQTCRVCDSPAHLAANCEFTKCYHCHQSGHIASRCPQLQEETKAEEPPQAEEASNSPEHVMEVSAEPPQSDEALQEHVTVVEVNREEESREVQEEVIEEKTEEMTDSQDDFASCDEEDMLVETRAEKRPAASSLKQRTLKRNKKKKTKLKRDKL